jgi:23S rRNA pseudouridine1911/1915/1917 synthase
VPAYTEVPGGIRLETPVGEHARTVAVESPLPEDMRALLDAEI